MTPFPMMNDENENGSLNTEHEINHAGEDHMTTDGHVHTHDHSDDHMHTTEASSVSQPVVSLKKNLSWQKILLIVIAVLLIVVGGLSTYVYTHASTDKNVQAITSKLPFPAVLVGRSVITYTQYYEERDALEKYFASLKASGSQEPAKDQLNQMIVDTLINKVMVQKLAVNDGITLDPKRVDDFYQNIVKSDQGDVAFTKQLHDTFGWTPAEFKTRIVNSIVLATQVSDYIAADKTMQQPQTDLINQAHTRVTTGKEDFETVAKDVHTKAQVNINSDLGFIKTSEIPSSWASKVTSLQKDQISDVIELPTGYAIFKLTDRQKSGTDEELHLLTVTVPKKTLEQVVAEYLKNVAVRKLIKV